MHVSDETIHIGNRQYNIDFIILPTFKEGMVRAFSWTRFYKRINWDTQFPTPEKFHTIDFGVVHGKHVYQSCPPFILEEEECGDWLTWETISLAEEDDVKALAVKAHDPAETNLRKTKIAEHINFPVWATQLAAEALPTIQMSRSPSEEMIKSTEAAITAGIEKMTKILEEKIRSEMSRTPYNGPGRFQGGNFRSRREDRQRSPDHRRRSRSPPNQRRSPATGQEAPRSAPSTTEAQPLYQPGYMYATPNGTPYHQGQAPGMNPLTPQQGLMAPNLYGSLQQPAIIPGIGQPILQLDNLAQRQRYGNNQ